MKRIQLENHKYIIKYNRAEEMPLKRYAKFQKYLLYKTGVGSTIESVGDHFSNLFGFVTHEMNPEIKKEAENLYYNFFAILQEVSYEDLAFAAMIYSVDGEILTDVSEENLMKVITWLSDNGMTKELVNSEVQDTRETILNDLKIWFPKFYPEENDLDFFAKTKQKLMLTSENILNELENEGEVPDSAITDLLKEISLFFVKLRQPKNFNPNESSNAVVSLESSFEALCSMIEANGSTNAKELTLIEFYSRLEFIRKSNEANTSRS